MRDGQRTIWRCAILFAACAAIGVSADAADELPVDPDAEAALLALAGGDEFRIHRTEHFLICYNTDKGVLRDFVTRVEATYRGNYRFLGSHDIPHEPPTRRLEILFFETPDEFQDYAGRIGADMRGAAGFYQPASNRAAFYNARNAARLTEVNREIARLEAQVKRARGGRNSERGRALKQMRRLRNTRDQTIETINLVVVQHEVTHQVFFNAGLHARTADNPAWLVEGLACLFETAPSSQGAGMGAVNQYRLLGFHEALAGSRGWKSAKAEQFADACRTRRMVPLRQLMGDGTLFATSGPHAEQRYAQAWSLVHFLQRRRREEFGVYLTVLARRPTDRGYSGAREVTLFERVFGPLDTQFEQQWLDYILKQRVRPPK